MKTITRRTALAGAGALPLLPVTAYAGTDDPAVKAYEQWRAAYDAFSRALDRPDYQDGCPILKATHDQEFAARLALSDAVATTPAGLARQVRFAFDVFGERISGDHSIDDPASFEFHNWAENHEGRLLCSMLKGAENMAGVAS